MGLFDLLRKGKSKFSVEKDDSKVSFKSKVSAEMRNQLKKSYKGRKRRSFSEG